MILTSKRSSPAEKRRCGLADGCKPDWLSDNAALQTLPQQAVD
jgi:hypothetical protein